MAIVDLIPQEILDSGVTPAYTGPLSVADTYHVVNDGRVFLHFKKTGGNDCTVTFDVVPTYSGLAVADRTLVVPQNTGDKMIGPFNPRIFNDAAGGYLAFTLSEISGLTVGVLRVPRRTSDNRG
jgi:hypothetical protein